MGGIVVCPEPLAADAGAEILRMGGNAMDAAAAGAFAQGVVNPLLCGIGGCGVLVAFAAATGEVLCIRFWGTAGSRVRPNIFAADVLGGRPGETVRVRGDRNSMGYEAVVVPGFVRGVAEGMRRCGSGRIGWDALVAPAVRLARDGFEVDAYIDRFWAPDPLLDDIPPAPVRLAATEASAAIYLRDGRPPRQGERLVQVDYACTLERLAGEGPESFYDGAIGDAIGHDFEKHGGLFTRDDLRRYRPLVGEPIWGAYQDLAVATDPPPGSGTLVIELLNLLEGVDLRALRWNSPAYLDVLARCMRAVFGDRAHHMADPRFRAVPTGRLTSKTYASEVRRGLWTGSGHQIQAGTEGHEGTTHISVVDAQGNAVAITHTTRDSSGVVTEGLGFLYNNDMATFDPVPGHLNSISPGRMGVTGGAPTIFLKDGQAVMVIGSPAGPRKVTALVQAVLNVTVFGMTMPEAVAAERIHCETGAITVEPGFPEHKADALRALGHAVVTSPYTARLAAVLRDRATGELSGGTDPRGGRGLAVVP